MLKTLSFSITTLLLSLPSLELATSSCGGTYSPLSLAVPWAAPSSSIFLALHLAREDASRSHQLKERAEMHFAIGVHRAIELLPNLNQQNCAELYIAAILICFHTLAKKPSNGHPLVSDSGGLHWWELFKGIILFSSAN